MRFYEVLVGLVQSSSSDSSVGLDTSARSRWGVDGLRIETSGGF
jgi:hypothetical protein